MAEGRRVGVVGASPRFLPHRSSRPYGHGTTSNDRVDWSAGCLGVFGHRGGRDPGQQPIGALLLSNVARTNDRKGFPDA
jgi:hypothetical protein